MSFWRNVTTGMFSFPFISMGKPRKRIHFLNAAIFTHGHCCLKTNVFYQNTLQCFNGIIEERE